MKKIISAVLAGALCAGAFVSCGDKEKEKGSKDSALSTKGKSEYTAMRPTDGNVQPFKESIDKGIKYSINRAKEFQEETDAEYSPYVIKFSGDEFIMPYERGAYCNFYDGTFSIKNGTIKFSYENYITPDKDYKVNINDKVEYDMDIIKGTAEKLDGLSSEEKKEMKKEEQEKMAAEAVNKRMQKLNEYGSYCKFAAPSMNADDKWNDFAALPYIRYAKMNKECTDTLKTVDKFLCTDTYGIELDGKYKKGKGFTLKHDLEDTLKDDEQSPYRWEESPEEWLEKKLRRAEIDYNCDDLESTIKFSDGKWEWYNDDDALLNNGKYEESKDYPGLIKMYVDEDSERCPDYAKNTYPLWFYIADDGEVYYPAFVKVE